MIRAILLLMLAFGLSLWGQSLGDVARENREHAKATKVITNDDIPGATRTEPSAVAGDLREELQHVRQILHQICSDPRTSHGRKLSDYDKRDIEDGVKPLRARVKEYEGVQKRYKDALAEIDKSWEEKFKASWPSGRPATEEDVDRVKALRRDYESEKTALQSKGESELQGYMVLQKELESVGKECPEAAKTVPD
jgi:hypothetical protein